MKPFDAATLGTLRALVDWLPNALDALRMSTPVPAFAAAPGPDAAPAAAVPEPVADHSNEDVLLVLHPQIQQLHDLAPQVDHPPKFLWKFGHTHHFGQNDDLPDVVRADGIERLFDLKENKRKLRDSRIWSHKGLGE